MECLVRQNTWKLWRAYYHWTETQKLPETTFHSQRKCININNKQSWQKCINHENQESVVLSSDLMWLWCPDLTNFVWFKTHEYSTHHAKKILNSEVPGTQNTRWFWRKDRVRIGYYQRLLGRVGYQVPPGAGRPNGNFHTFPVFVNGQRSLWRWCWGLPGRWSALKRGREALPLRVSFAAQSTWGSQLQKGLIWIKQEIKPENIAKSYLSTKSPWPLAPRDSLSRQILWPICHKLLQNCQCKKMKADANL